MKVILQTDVKGIGKRNQVLEVADGYARNFLLPRKLALPATAGGVKTVEKLAKDRSDRDDFLRAQAKENAAKLAAITVLLKARAGENGRLFGSITPQQIVEALKQQHHLVIDKRDLHVTESIRALGLHTTSVTLFAEIKATLQVEVASE